MTRIREEEDWHSKSTTHNKLAVTLADNTWTLQETCSLRYYYCSETSKMALTKHKALTPMKTITLSSCLFAALRSSEVLMLQWVQASAQNPSVPAPVWCWWQPLSSASSTVHRQLLTYFAKTFYLLWCQHFSHIRAAVDSDDSQPCWFPYYKSQEWHLLKTDPVFQKNRSKPADGHESLNRGVYDTKLTYLLVQSLTYNRCSNPTSYSQRNKEHSLPDNDGADVLSTWDEAGHDTGWDTGWYIQHPSWPVLLLQKVRRMSNGNNKNQ